MDLSGSLLREEETKVGKVPMMANPAATLEIYWLELESSCEIYE